MFEEALIAATAIVATKQDFKSDVHTMSYQSNLCARLKSILGTSMSFQGKLITNW